MKGLILTTLGVFILSFDALLIRLIDAPPFDLLFWRGFLMVFAVAIWCRYRESNPPLFATNSAYLRSALFFAISTICFVYAITLTSVANVLIIISIQPLIAAGLGHFFLGEKSKPITLLAMLISILGIVWVFSGSLEGSNLAGNLIALLCGITLAGKFVNDRSQKKQNMVPALAGASLLISIVSFIFGDPFSLQGTAWGWMLLYCTLVIPFSFILITVGLKYISAAEVSMLMLLETAIAPLWVWIWLGEVPGARTLEGGAIVIGTLFLYALYRSKGYKT